MKPMGEYYDRQGKPIELTDWAKRMNDSKYKIVKQTHNVGRGWMVSTVWLGLNHRFGEGPPLIFETMVFAEHDWLRNDPIGVEPGLPDHDQERYTTEEEALAGHEAMVQKWSTK